ncbi:KAP family P-loop NTPase fold protein [Salibacterium aidingense]|uniref:KAP family P-loop NTPase fold protein n=1 Tax=Salibacterium aidingense TaxID=384933 RepID=UPI003BD38C02
MWKDSETELDFLDFDYLIAMLKDIIEDKNLLPSTVGVYGDWGSGKSSLIKMSMRTFEEEENTECLVFNGWLFEGYEDAKTALLGSILDTIQENRKLSEKAQKYIYGLYKSVDKLKLLKTGMKYGADFITTGGIGTISDLTLRNIVSRFNESEDFINKEKVVDSIKDELNNKEIREDIKQFQSNFSELLKETNINKLVIFIDELDRCNPDTILETLEAIRLFLFTGSSVFIIGADERHISYAVKRKFEEIEGQQINIGKEYLEKIIQYPIRIPRLNASEVEFYITCLLFEKDLTYEEFTEIVDFLNTEKREDFLNFKLNYTLINSNLPHLSEKVKDSISVAKQLSTVLSQGLNGNPRHCKRFLNSLIMRERMAEYKNIVLDRKVLAKIMLLEYFKSGLYKKIAELQDTGDGFSEELNLLETNNLEDTSELKIWKDDNWVKDWCNISPKIGEVDLRPYFYFTRSSISEKLNTSTEKLSPTAKNIIENLLKKTKTGRNNALKMEAEVSDYESIEILDALFEQMQSETSIDKNIMQSYLLWGQNKEFLHSNVVNDLSSLTGDKISMSMIPFIKDFMEKAAKESEISEIAIKWSEENASSPEAIKKDLVIEGGE